MRCVALYLRVSTTAQAEEGYSLAAQGKRTCTYVLGYDNDGDSLKINEDEAKIVRFIYDQYLKTGNISHVSRLCIEKGYTGKRGGALDPENVRGILTRFVYCGYFSFDRKPYRGEHPKIISVSTYNKVQRMLLGNYYGRNRKHELVLLPEQKTH